MSRRLQRAAGVLLLLLAGMLGLPVAALLLDGETTENLVLPVVLVIMAVVGAAVTVALPSLAPLGATTGRRALTGAGWGLLAAGAGVLVFWLLLSGFDGA